MIDQLYDAMVAYEKDCPKRIQHFVKVHSFARHIGLAEGMDPHALMVLEAAALVHDIGIRPALQKYGSSAGPLQEREGMGVARELLTRIGFAAEDVERVVYLVGHHHTYHDIDGTDYQILVEADFLVNDYEHGLDKEHIAANVRTIFKTACGRKLAVTMFGLED